MQEFPYRIGIMLSSYSQAINKQNKTSGSLFQQKTKAKLLTESMEGRNVSYFEDCFFYIHHNPLAAGLVKQLTDWQYSSFLDYCEKRNGTLCKKELFFKNSVLTVADIINRSATEILPETISKLE